MRQPPAKRLMREGENPPFRLAFGLGKPRSAPKVTPARLRRAAATCSVNRSDGFSSSFFVVGILVISVYHYIGSYQGFQLPTPAQFKPLASGRT